MEIAIIILIFMIVAVIIMVALATTTWSKGSGYTQGNGDFCPPGCYGDRFTKICICPRNGS